MKTFCLYEINSQNYSLFDKSFLLSLFRIILIAWLEKHILNSQHNRKTGEYRNDNHYAIRMLQTRLIKDNRWNYEIKSHLYQPCKYRLGISPLYDETNLNELYKFTARKIYKNIYVYDRNRVMIALDYLDSIKLKCVTFEQN